MRAKGTPYHVECFKCASCGMNLKQKGENLLVLFKCVAGVVGSILIVVQGRKEMFYLMMHSTHFIYGY